MVDVESAKPIDNLLSSFDSPLLVVLPDIEEVTAIAAAHPTHVFVGSRDILPAHRWIAQPAPAASIAYVLFTSGSTGLVMVSHDDMNHFIRVMIDRYGFGAEDRFSQGTDLAFDVSTFDLFVPWKVGATVCCLTQRSLIQPDRFIREQALTV